MEHNRLWAGLFVLFMYEQKAPSGGEWSPENNALTDWCVALMHPYRSDGTDVVYWLTHSDATMFVSGAFIWKTHFSKWGKLHGKWLEKIKEHEKMA